jgi:hypothetical protein
MVREIRKDERNGSVRIHLTDEMRKEETNCKIVIFEIKNVSYFGDNSEDGIQEDIISIYIYIHTHTPIYGARKIYMYDCMELQFNF